MDHMLNCTEKLLGAGDSGMYSKLPSELGQANCKTASSHQRGNKEPQTDASSPSAHGKQLWIGHKLLRFYAHMEVGC